MQKGQMSNENPYFRNAGSGPRFYDGQLGSRGGNQTRDGGGRRGGFSGRSGTVTEIPGGVPRRAGGVQGRRAGVLMRGVRVLRNGDGVLGRSGGVPGRGDGVSGRGAGVPRRAGGVLAMGAGVVSRVGGVLGREGGVPGRLGGEQRVDGVSVGTGGVQVRPGKVSGLDGSCRVNKGGENVSMRASGNMGRYMTSRSEVKSSLLTTGGGYGLNGESSFTYRGSFARKGQDHVALKRGFGMATRGGASMKNGGALCRGGIGISRGGGIGRIGAIATVKNDTRDIQLTQGVTRGIQLTRGVNGGVQLTQGVTRGVHLTQVARGAQGMTRGVQITEGVGDMARTSGMGMRIGGLKSSWGEGMNKGRGGFDGAMGVIRNGGFSGTRVTAGVARGRNGAVGVTRDGGISGIRVIASSRGGRGCNGATRKSGNSTAGLMTGVVLHEKISTPGDTTSNTSQIKREIEVIDLDEIADMVEEKPVINVQNVNQEPLSEEDIRDRYYGGLNNFEENGFDINNKIGDQLTVMKNDADGSLKLVMKATVNPNISVSIVNDKISSNKNKYQGCEQSETDDKVMKDNIKIKENDTANTECIKNVDKVETDDIKDEDITNDSVSMSVRRNTKNIDIYKKPTELSSFVETGNTVNVDDVMEASNRLETSDKTKPNHVMFENSVESNSLLQVEDSWVDIDAVKLIIEGASLKPFNVNGEEILFERRIDVTESDQNCYILEVNPVTKGNSENNNVTCVADNSPIKSPNQITENSPRSQYQMEAPKRMNISSENIEMDSDLFSIDKQSWKESNSSIKPPSQMVQYRPKSQYQVKVSQKKCFINLEKLNISLGNHFMEVHGVSYKVHQQSWKGKPNNNDAKEKSVEQNRSNKSWVWKYITQEPATGGITKAFCTLCSKSINYFKRSTKSFKTHLRCCHAEDIEANERKVNHWMLRYANQVTETGNMVSSSGSVPGRKRYVCKLCSKTVRISHFLQNFKLLHRDKL